MYVDCAMAVFCKQLEGNLLALSMGRAFPLHQLDKVLVYQFWSQEQGSSYWCLHGKERGCVTELLLLCTGQECFRVPHTLCQAGRMPPAYFTSLLRLVLIQG